MAMNTCFMFLGFSFLVLFGTSAAVTTFFSLSVTSYPSAEFGYTTFDAAAPFAATIQTFGVNEIYAAELSTPALTYHETLDKYLFTRPPASGSVQTLYEVDRTNGLLTPFADFSFDATTRNIISMAFDKDRNILYGLLYGSSSQLVSIDLSVANVAAVTVLTTLALPNYVYNEIAYDSFQSRLLAATYADVYIVDYMAANPLTYLSASAGYPTALAVDPVDGSFYLNEYYSTTTRYNGVDVYGDLADSGHYFGGLVAMPEPNQAPSIPGTISFTPSTEIEVGRLLTVSVPCDDPEGDAVTVYVDYEGDDVSDAQRSCSVPGSVTFTHRYSSPGVYCLKLCLDDGQDVGGCDFTQISCGVSTKRATVGQGTLITVGASGGGDPYFVGFQDKQLFRFDGLVGHVYNLISAPFVQVNTKIESGISSDLQNRMQAVMRSLAVMWGQENILEMSFSHQGQLYGRLFMEGGWNELEVTPASAQVGTVRLHWAPSINTTRQSSGQREHRVWHQMTLLHKLFRMDIYAVSLQVREMEFFFLDTQVTLLHQAVDPDVMCLDGVWGRTTCTGSTSPYEMREFDLNGEMLSTEFPLHNQYHS